jgi:hypothetical protein
MEIIIGIYFLGYAIAVGYQYQAIEYYSPNDGVLNRVFGSIILGTFSWIIVGVAIYNYSENVKKDKEKG